MRPGRRVIPWQPTLSGFRPAFSRHQASPVPFWPGEGSGSVDDESETLSGIMVFSAVQFDILLCARRNEKLALAGRAGSVKDPGSSRIRGLPRRRLLPSLCGQSLKRRESLISAGSGWMDRSQLGAVHSNAPGAGAVVPRSITIASSGTRSPAAVYAGRRVPSEGRYRPTSR